MHLLFIVPNVTKGKGGAERVACELANHMAAQGFRLSILCNAEADSKCSYPLSEGVELLCRKISDNTLLELRSELKLINPSVIFGFYSHYDLFQQFIMTYDLDIPVGFQECTNPVRSIRKMADNPKIADINLAFQIRSAILSGVQGIRFTLPSYLQSLPIYVETYGKAFANSFQTPKQKAEITNDKAQKTILCVSGLKAPNKNGIVLAHAFANLSKKYPDWLVRFVGRCSKEIKPKINKLCEAHTNIQVTDTVDDVYKEYRDAQINVICSFEEGLPNVVCEAMLHGVPSIGFSDCAGTNDLIVDKENGLLIGRADEINNLTSAIEELILDPVKRKKYGDAAAELAHGMFDPKKIYGKWQQFFRDIVEVPASQNTFIKEQSKLDPLGPRRAGLLRKLLFESYNSSAFKLEENKKSEISGKMVNTSSILSLQCKNTSPKVSVIIPVYNKEEFLPSTLDSVFSDTYPNKEIIIVDDASTDKSGSIIAEYHKKFGNVKILKHEKNCGLSASRNTGYAHATGEFIQFWDADDIYHSGSLSRIVRTMLVNDNDIATGLAVRNGAVLSLYKEADYDVDHTTYLEFPGSFSTNSTCFKIYRKDFLDLWDLKFVEGLYIQDFEFNFKAFTRATSVGVTSCVIGEYRKTHSSASAIVNAARIESTFEINKITREYVLTNELEEFEVLRQRHIMRLVFMFFISRLLNDTPDISRDHRKIYLARYREILSGFKEGLLELQLTEPHWACAIIALCNNHNRLAHRFLRKSKIEQTEWEFLRPNVFGFSSYYIDQLKRSYSELCADLSWSLQRSKNH